MTAVLRLLATLALLAIPAAAQELRIGARAAAWSLGRGLDMPTRGDGYTFATTIRTVP